MLEKTGDVNTPLEKYTNTFCDLALEMDEKIPEKEVAEIRGPLYAHGWQMMLRQLVVVGEHGSGRHSETGTERMNKDPYLVPGGRSAHVQPQDCSLPG